MATYKLQAFISPKSGRDAEFRAWYQQTHVRDVLALPGFGRAEQFVVSSPGDEAPRYLTVYDVEADGPEDVLARVRAGQPGFRHSDAADASTIVVVVALSIGTFVAPG